MLNVPQNPEASNEPTLDEMCPACHTQIPLQDIFSAVCPNGHVWSQCHNNLRFKEHILSLFHQPDVQLPLSF